MKYISSVWSNSVHAGCTVPRAPNLRNKSAIIGMFHTYETKPHFRELFKEYETFRFGGLSRSRCSACDERDAYSYRLCLNCTENQRTILSNKQMSGRRIIMATVAHTIKDSRFDMRMTRDQRSEVERAAAIKGKSLTQWALDNLLESARRDIEEETTTYLSRDVFDAFAAALEEPVPEKTQRLLARKPVWA